MSKEIDEILIETNKMDAELAETKHQLDVNQEWNDIFWKALRMACERIAVAAHLNYFDLSEDEQYRIVHDLMMDYSLKAQEELNGKHR